MQDVFLQQQSPPPLPQEHQQHHHHQHHDMLASDVIFTPSTPPRSSFVAPSQMDALYRSYSNDSNASSASPNSATSYASAPPLLSPTHPDPMLMESPPLLHASSSNGEISSNNNSSSGRRYSRRPAPLKIDASPKGRRPPSRLSIEVPPNYLQQQHNRARDGASPYPLPGGLASPISPYPLYVEAGSTRPMTPTQQAAAQREMEQLLGQLDNFLGPEGGDSQSMPPTMSSSPNRPVVPLRSPCGGPHLSIPSRMRNGLSPPASFEIASFEISGVTLNEADLALLDDAEFNNEMTDASKPYPASAPAWQTTFNFGPQGQYGAPHPSQQAYSSRPPQYIAPLESYQMGWSHGAAYLHDNTTNTNAGPPIPTTPRNQMTAMPSYHQRRQSVHPGSTSSPVRPRRLSDGLSAHTTHYTASHHPNRMSYPYFEQQPQHQPPQHQTQRSPYMQQQYSYGYGPPPSASSSTYPTNHPSSMPHSVPNDFAQPLSPVSPPKSPTKRVRASPPKSTVPLPPSSPVRPLPTDSTAPAVTTMPAPKKSGALTPMFINYSANDKKKLLGGVAPSGSSKKKREEAEAAARATAGAAAAELGA